MTGLILALVAGSILGQAVTAILRRFRRDKLVAVVNDLLDEDRDHIAINFAAHLDHMRSQVSSFADELAGDDVLLRERLRMFEGGDRS
ncbi:hypothetical protein ASC61_01995 [Aeromicrobium sp. Root344]|uniref:hypothetical protein n=1 Tax=Aeromicrobium sp. Root344 TaxID=1736521 RepID=UPI0006F1DA5E|nr:hypothetical protein [Aeromicrobium sp. Root344]KQV73876.1 hypothetical protein ASC61_01995 [Aeromicrobium sp. Root344]